MAKNMYQKREERKNKKMNEDGKSFSNVSINWYIPTYGKHHSNPYK